MTQKIEAVIKQGIPFVLSAGNYAETHWKGDFVDDDRNNWHEFESNDEGLSFNVDFNRVVNGIPLVAYLLWDNLANQQNDFDLTLKDPDGKIVATSSNVQGQNQQNAEYVRFVPEDVGIYSLGVSYDQNSRPSAILEIFSETDKLEYSIPLSSVNVPTDAKGAFVVGAFRYELNALEPFSSQGPTRNHKEPVPNLVGPSGVRTLSHGPNFSGTSAAAPHVAGLVALLLESDPNLSPDVVAKMLQSNTDRTSVLLETGYDNIYGYGKAYATFLNEYLNLLPEIPSWIKNTAGWWAEGSITDEDFVKGVEFLIKEGIISIPSSQDNDPSSEDQINSEGAFELPKYKQTTGIEISGIVDDYKKGTDVQVVITKPDGVTEEHRVIASKDGHFMDSYELDHSAEIGIYQISVQYRSAEVELRSFEVVEEFLEGSKIKIEIPTWVKNNADWWSKDQIEDSDFVSGIQFLIRNEIMNIR